MRYNYELDDLRDDYEEMVHSANIRYLETIFYLFNTQEDPNNDDL